MSDSWQPFDLPDTTVQNPSLPEVSQELTMEDQELTMEDQELTMEDQALITAVDAFDRNKSKIIAELEKFAGEQAKKKICSEDDTIATCIEKNIDAIPLDFTREEKISEDDFLRMALTVWFIYSFPGNRKIEEFSILDMFSLNNFMAAFENISATLRRARRDEDVIIDLFKKTFENLMNDIDRMTRSMEDFNNDFKKNN